jgi:hypothetical protein
MLSCCNTVRYAPHAAHSHLPYPHPRRWTETTSVIAIPPTRISSSTSSISGSKRAVCRPPCRWKARMYACPLSATPIRASTSITVLEPQGPHSPSSESYNRPLTRDLRRMGYGLRHRPRPSLNLEVPNPKPKPKPKPKPIPTSKEPRSRRQDPLGVSVKSEVIPRGMLRHRREVCRISCGDLTRASEPYSLSLTVNVLSVLSWATAGVDRYVP